MISSIKLSLLAQLRCNRNDMLEYRSSAVTKRRSYANFLQDLPRRASAQTKTLVD